MGLRYSPLLRKRRFGLWMLAGILCAGWPLSASGAATQLLPDLFAWENERFSFMHNGVFDTSTDPTRALYRFNLPLVNIGAGPLEITEQTDAQDTQDVFQHIYDDAGGMTEVHVGTFANAQPAFGHLYFVALARYNLRAVEPGGGVGPIVSSHDKISFGIVDSIPYDDPPPGTPGSAVYTSAANPVLGISVGWADLYGRHLPGQWVDATGLADGMYWLEVVIDPENRVIESDDTNNTTRILVDLVIPDVLLLGDANNDLLVSGSDLIAVQENFGKSESPATGLLLGDADDDGQVSGVDLVSVQENYGNAAAPGAPEPVTGLLLLIGTVTTFRRAERR